MIDCFERERVRVRIIDRHDLGIFCIYVKKLDDTVGKSLRLVLNSNNYHLGGDFTIVGWEDKVLVLARTICVVAVPKKKAIKRKPKKKKKITGLPQEIKDLLQQLEKIEPQDKESE